MTVTLQRYLICFTISEKSNGSVGTHGSRHTGSIGGSSKEEMIQAAIQKTELVCQMDELRKRRELDKLEEELRFKREMLAVQFQLSKFEARLSILHSETDALHKFCSETDKSREKVKSWLEGSDGGESRQSEMLREYEDIDAEIKVRKNMKQSSRSDKVEIEKSELPTTYGHELHSPLQQ